MAKKAIGKIIVALLSVVLCFGFVGVKEAHAATNKVINQKTGAQYNTLSAAISALGQGSPEDSVTLTVDGTINETTANITVDYRGELSIVGGSGGGTILHYHNNNSTGGDRHAKIIFTKNSKIKTIKNIMFKGSNLPTSPGGSIACYCHKLYFYGTVEELNHIGYWDVYGGGTIYCCSGSEIGRIINCNYYAPQDYRTFIFIVEENATVGLIDNSVFDILRVAGTVGRVENSTFKPQIGYAGVRPVGLAVYETGSVGTIKNSELGGVAIRGSVDILDGIKVIGFWFDGGDPSDTDYPVLTIFPTGRVNKIIGGPLIACAEEVDGYCMLNASQYPVELEPDLNGTDLAEGYGRYGGVIYDRSGTIVLPVSSDGFYYDAPIVLPEEDRFYYNWPDVFPNEKTWSIENPNGTFEEYVSYCRSILDPLRGSDGYFRLKVGTTPAPVDVTIPLSKRLLQNTTSPIPEMSFEFEFEQLSEYNGVSYVSSDECSAPIGNKAITINAQSDTLASDPYVGDLTGKKLYEGKIENVLEGWTAPATSGTYAYRVKEVQPSTPVEGVTYTKSEFIMLVEVGSNGEITPMPCILDKDSSGNTKNQYSTPPAVFDEKHELIFYNNYGTEGGTTPTGIITNILPFIVIGGAGVGGLALYVVINVKRRKKDIS